MDSYRGTFGTYIAGFVGSLVCTCAAYYLVVVHPAAPALILAAVIALATFQFGVQLVLFLHLGRSAKVWNVVAFAFAFIIVCIVVAGSLWIMQNLSGRMMPSQAQMMQYMNNQDSL